MKKSFIKILPKLLSIAIPIAVVGFILIPHQAHAVSLDGITHSFINNAVAWLGNLVLEFLGGLVTIAGTFLSVSISITLHIKDIYETITGISSVWITIRDLSSIFIIFALLWVSIKMILGLQGSNFGQLVVKVFLAGLLINFSLFFVKVAVDASNLVSLQFYNAITPQPTSGQNPWTVASAYYDGGLSNVFMQSLKIPTIYKNVDLKKGADVTVGIIFAIVGGIAMMIVAAFSFFAAAIAFTVRTALLLVIMALSPLFFVGMIFPEIKKKVSDKILGMLMSQLVFMPVYLFLMYVALRIISDKNFMAIFNQNAVNGTDKGFFGVVSIGVIIQYVIAIVFINLPLLAAIELGAVGMKWAPTAKDVGGFFGRNTIGRMGQLAGKGFDRMAANAQESRMGRIVGGALSATGISRKVRQGLTEAEKGKYGGTESLVDVQKYDKERKKTISNVQRKAEQLQIIKQMTSYDGIGTTDQFRKTVSGMDVKELEALDFKRLKDPRVATSLSPSKFDSLMKSDALTPAQQQELRTAREDGFKQILTGNTDKSTEKGADELLKTILKNKPQDIAKLPKDILADPIVAVKLDAATLRKMVDENVDRDTRDKVREAFDSHLAAAGTTVTPDFQRAYDYMNSPAGQIF